MAYTYFDIPDAVTAPETLGIVIDDGIASAVISWNGEWRLLDRLDSAARPNWLPVSSDGTLPVFHADFGNSLYWFRGRAYGNWSDFATATGASGIAVFSGGLSLGNDTDPTWTTGTEPFLGWSQEEGTFFLDYDQTSAPAGTEVILSADDGSTALRRVTFFSANEGQEQLSITVSTPTHTAARSMLVGPAAVGRRKVAFSYRDNCVIGARGEKLVRNATASEYEAFGITKLWLGRRGASDGSPTSGAVLKSVTYFDRALGSPDIARFTGLRFNPDGGIWTWFNDPRALKIDDNTVLVGGMSGDGRSLVRELDIQTKRFGPARYLLDLVTDDHTNPGFVMTDKGACAMHTRHNGSAYKRHRRLGPGKWDAGVDLAGDLQAERYAYANPVRMENGRIFNFMRAGTSPDWSMYFSYSDDNAESWVPAVKVLSGERPYFKVRKTGPERVDFICNDAHPGATPTNSVYHFYLDTAAGTWHLSDGTVLGALPYLPATDLSMVHDGTGARTWVWDVTLHEENPVACFAAFPTNDDHRLRQARWNGSAWISREVCAAGGNLYPDTGQPHYSGGIITDPENVDVVYCSRQVDAFGNIDAENGHFQIFRYRTQDGGLNWSGEQLTFGSAQCFRPYVPEGTRLLLFNKAARYTSYTNYDCDTGVIDISNA